MTTRLIYGTDLTAGKVPIVSDDNELVDALSVGYFGVWSGSGIDDTPETIIANGAGDVSAVITLLYAVQNETSGTGGGVVNLTPNTSFNIYSDTDADNVLTMTCAADGSVSVARTAGAQTYSLIVWGVWL